MLLSLTVTLIETSGEITYGLPLLLVNLIAKWVGDEFNDGLYDSLIYLNQWPFLDWEPQPEHHFLKASDLMETSFVVAVFLHFSFVVILLYLQFLFFF